MNARPEVTDTAMWELIRGGCNVAEICEYLGVSRSAAWAMMAHATKVYTDGEERRDSQPKLTMA